TASQHRRRQGLLRESRSVHRSPSPASPRLRSDDGRRSVALHRPRPRRRRRYPRLLARGDGKLPPRLRAHGGQRSSRGARGVVLPGIAGAAPLPRGQSHANQVLPLAAGSDRLSRVPPPPDARLASARGRAGQSARRDGAPRDGGGRQAIGRSSRRATRRRRTQTRIISRPQTAGPTTSESGSASAAAASAASRATASVKLCPLSVASAFRARMGVGATPARPILIVSTRRLASSVKSAATPTSGFSPPARGADLTDPPRPPSGG